MGLGPDPCTNGSAVPSSSSRRPFSDRPGPASGPDRGDGAPAGAFDPALPLGSHCTGARGTAATLTLDAATGGLSTSRSGPVGWQAPGRSLPGPPTACPMPAPALAAASLACTRPRSCCILIAAGLGPTTCTNGSAGLPCSIRLPFSGRPGPASSPDLGDGEPVGALNLVFPEGSTATMACELLAALSLRSHCTRARGAAASLTSDAAAGGLPASHSGPVGWQAPGRSLPGTPASCPMPAPALAAASLACTRARSCCILTAAGLGPTACTNGSAGFPCSNRLLFSGRPGPASGPDLGDGEPVGALNLVFPGGSTATMACGTAVLELMAASLLDRRAWSPARSFLSRSPCGVCAARLNRVSCGYRGNSLVGRQAPGPGVPLSPPQPPKDWWKWISALLRLTKLLLATSTAGRPASSENRLGAGTLVGPRGLVPGFPFSIWEPSGHTRMRYGGCGGFLARRLRMRSPWAVAVLWHSLLRPLP